MAEESNVIDEIRGDPAAGDPDDEIVEIDPVGEIVAVDPADRGIGAKAHAYFMLTKPRIIVLLLVTTLPAMILAEGGFPSALLMINTLVGGSLAAGGANAVNCYVDRDIDEKMNRTNGRPLPSGDVSPRNALIFGLVLGVVSFGYLTATVNVLTAALALGALAFYVIVYTILLKRSTAQNIVIGGVAGAVPVLCGWAAVRNSLSLAPIVMFFIVFFWTPPHFWALAIRYRDDYARAGVPMLPVTHGIAESTRHILLYSWQLVAVSLLLYPAGRMGPVYLVAAVVLGFGFLANAYRLRREQTPEAAMKLFKFSITYLFLLFVAVAVDVFVHP